LTYYQATNFNHMADVAKLRGDVAWWKEEIRILEGKLRNAKSTLEQRKLDLANAEREEAEEKRRPSANKTGGR
jgi:hypothetical protein